MRERVKIKNISSVSVPQSYAIYSRLSCFSKKEASISLPACANFYNQYFPSLGCNQVTITRRRYCSENGIASHQQICANVKFPQGANSSRIQSFGIDSGFMWLCIPRRALIRTIDLLGSSRVKFNMTSRTNFFCRKTFKRSHLQPPEGCSRIAVCGNQSGTGFRGSA